MPVPDRVSESLIPDHGDMGAVLQKRHGKEIFHQELAQCMCRFLLK